MDFVLDAYCGLYCGACPILLNTRAGTGAEQCHGCKSEKPTRYCDACGIKACAQGRGFAACYQCDELKTCELMLKFASDKKWPYQQCVWKNMATIREEGLPKWLELQERRWRCASCGAMHSWWEETCPECGRAVASYQADL